MNESALIFPFDLDETDALGKIPAGCSQVALRNPDGAPLDAAALFERLRRDPNVGGVHGLHIGASSHLVDLQVCRVMPQLKTLGVYGLRIATLEGVDAFNGTYIDIATDRNKKRKLDALDGTRASRLQLIYGHADDLAVVGSCHALRDVTLGKVPSLDLSLWKKSRIEDLTVNAGSIRTLADTYHIESLRRLSLLNCHKFEGFGGDCGNVREARIDASKVTDTSTIGRLSGLEWLTWTTSRGRSVPISLFLSLTKLRTLRFEGRDIVLDERALKRRLPDLENLYLPLLDDREIALLSLENRGVAVSNNQVKFVDGGRVPW